MCPALQRHPICTRRSSAFLTVTRMCVVCDTQKRGQGLTREGSAAQLWSVTTAGPECARGAWKSPACHRRHRLTTAECTAGGLSTPRAPQNSYGPHRPANTSSGPAVCSHSLHFVPTVPRDGWLASFTEEVTRGPERTHRLSRVTQPANGRVGNWVQASLWAPMLYPSTACGVPRSPHACFWRDLLDSEEAPEVPGSHVVHPDLNRTQALRGLPGRPGPEL